MIINFTSFNLEFFMSPVCLRFLFELPLIVSRQIENVANGKFKLLVHVLLVEAHFPAEIDDLKLDVIILICKSLGTYTHHIRGDFWH